MTNLKRSIPDGTLLRAEGRPDVWLIIGDTRWGIPSGRLLRSVAPGEEVLDLPLDELVGIRTTPPDGTVVAGSETGRFYLIVCCIRFWLAPEHLLDLGLALEPVIEVHDELMTAVPYGGKYRTWISKGRLRCLTANTLRLAHDHAADTRGVVIGVFASAVFFIITKLLAG